jgi:beta-galactosidase
MVRLWTWQAFAHGAEVVSYFRWRQAPFAQEQMHTGLHRPDHSLDQGGVEATQVGAELAALRKQLDLAPTSAAIGIVNRVALVFDYTSVWMAQIQPQGADYNPVELHFRVYSALRQLGLDVDIVHPNAPLAGYALIVLPVQLHVDAALAQSLSQAAAAGAQIVLGPRSGSKSASLTFPMQDEAGGEGSALPPGPLATLAGVRVERVASLPPGLTAELRDGAGLIATVQRWREDLSLHGAVAESSFVDDDRPAVTVTVGAHGSVRYVAGWLADADWLPLLQRAAHAAGLAAEVLPEGLRTSRVGALTLACNFSDQALTWQPAPDPSGAHASSSAVPVVGSATLAPRGLALWHTAQPPTGADPATKASS